MMIIIKYLHNGDILKINKEKVLIKVWYLIGLEMIKVPRESWHCRKYMGNILHLIVINHDFLYIFKLFMNNVYVRKKTSNLYYKLIIS